MFAINIRKIFNYSVAKLEQNSSEPIISINNVDIVEAPALIEFHFFVVYLYIQIYTNSLAYFIYPARDKKQILVSK